MSSALAWAPYGCQGSDAMHERLASSRASAAATVHAWQSRPAHLPCGDAACTRALRACHGSPYTANAASCCCRASMLAGPAAQLACRSDSASRLPATGLQFPLAGSHTGMHVGNAPLPAAGAASATGPAAVACCCWADPDAGGCACCCDRRCSGGAASGVGSSGAGSLCCLATLRMASSDGMRWCRAEGLRTVRSAVHKNARAGTV